VVQDLPAALAQEQTVTRLQVQGKPAAAHARCADAFAARQAFEFLVRPVVPDKFVGAVPERPPLDGFPGQGFVHLAGKGCVFR